MQRYFSTPYYLLKLNQLTNKSAISSIVSTPGSKKKDDSNLFWSLTLGDCVLTSFFSFGHGFDEAQQNRSLISIKKPTSTLKPPQIQSLTETTKFFSPINNTTVKKDNEGTVYYEALTSSDLTQDNSNKNVIMSNFTTNYSNFYSHFIVFKIF